jgi:O-acetyl-ADP-ribose deacetylase (regulator of RNase III)
MDLNENYFKRVKIHLIDINKEMTDTWKKYFEFTNVSIHNTDLQTFLDDEEDVDAIVAPANSFGLMTGGYDKAIINCLGQQAQTNVLTMLDKVYNGYQPIGTCLAVPFYNYFILHTPTMRKPEEIIDPRVIFDCMYSCLVEAKKHNCKSILIPAFGGLTGKVPKETIAYLMRMAYDRLLVPPANKNWYSFF